MQFIDLKAQYAALKKEMDAAIEKVLEDGQFIMGRHVQELEEQISEYIGIKHTITCANGTDALQLLYMAYGIGRGDAVFCPDITFIASVEPACMLGASPVFCDITMDTFNIDPQSLERQIKRVKKEGRLCPRAIVAVDFLGNPADYVTLKSIAQKYGLLLIEDAAQSFGGASGTKMCGSFGDSATTSFFPAKPLGCYGDGGAVMTGDDAVAALCRSLRVHGQGASKYENIRIGVNSRLDTLQAAILQVKLKALRAYEMDRRDEVAARYNAAFSGKFQCMRVAPGDRPAYAQYALLADDKAQRNAILEKLSQSGVPSMVYYPHPLHTLKAFSGADAYGESFETAGEYCARTFSLPMHPYLQKSDQAKIIDCVYDALK